MASVWYNSLSIQISSIHHVLKSRWQFIIRLFTSSTSSQSIKWSINQLINQRNNQSDNETIIDLSSLLTLAIVMFGDSAVLSSHLWTNLMRVGIWHMSTSINIHQSIKSTGQLDLPNEHLQNHNISDGSAVHRHGPFKIREAPSDNKQFIHLIFIIYSTMVHSNWLVVSIHSWTCVDLAVSIDHLPIQSSWLQAHVSYGVQSSTWIS